MPRAEVIYASGAPVATVRDVRRDAAFYGDAVPIVGSQAVAVTRDVFAKEVELVVIDPSDLVQRALVEEFAAGDNFFFSDSAHMDEYDRRVRELVPEKKLWLASKQPNPWPDGELAAPKAIIETGAKLIFLVEQRFYSEHLAHADVFHEFLDPDKRMTAAAKTRLTALQRASSCIGFNGNIVTVDGYLIATRRGAETVIGTYPNALATTFSGPPRMGELTGLVTNVRQLVLARAHKETNIVESDVIDIIPHTYGMQEDAGPMLLFLVRSNLTLAQLLGKMENAEERMQNGKVFAVPFNPDGVRAMLEPQHPHTLLAPGAAWFIPALLGSMRCDPKFTRADIQYAQAVLADNPPERAQAIGLGLNRTP
jgi:hypothetical protein